MSFATKARSRDAEEAGLDDDSRPQHKRSRIDGTPPRAHVPSLPVVDPMTNEELYRMPDTATWDRVTSALDFLSHEELKAAIRPYVLGVPSIRSGLLREYDRKLEAIRAEVSNFDHISEKVWHRINTKYGSPSGSKQYDEPYDVYNYILECINSIGIEAHANRSFSTRRNALLTLRKIGETICIGGDCSPGHEVQQEYRFDTALADAMFNIADIFSDEEKDMMLVTEQDGFTFEAKMKELEELCRSYNGHEDIKDVLVCLGATDARNAEADASSEESDWTNEEAKAIKIYLNGPGWHVEDSNRENAVFL